MKYFLGLIIGLGLTMSACEDESDLDILSQQDQIALEEMEQQIALAALYNDSLANYIEETGTNNDVRCWYFDEHYHQHDSLYQMHHNNFSHANGWNGHMMGNGGMMQGQYHNQQGNFSGGTGNCQWSYEFMDSLNNVHEGIHPHQ